MNQPVTQRYAEYRQIRSDLRESSVEIMDRAVRWFVELFCDLNVDEITFGHIDDYKKWLSNGRSPGTVNTYVGMLKSFINWLARRRYISSSPFEGIRLMKVVQKKYEIYTPDEIKRIYVVADLIWKTIISLALCGSIERHNPASSKMFYRLIKIFGATGLEPATS